MAYHLKLTRGLSYNGIVAATMKNPDVFTDDAEIAAAAVATRYFRLVTSEEKPPVEVIPEIPRYSAGELNAMTVDELKTLASAAGVKETKGFKKSDYVNAVLWAFGDYSTGSPTMIDLQE